MTRTWPHPRSRKEEKEAALASPTLATEISPHALKRLREQFRGALLRPGEEGYDEARRIWNGAIDRYPALIARCAGADDVMRPSSSPARTNS